MKEDFSELVQYLDKKFTKIDDNFLDVHNKFQKLENKLDDKTDKSDFNQLLNSVDAYAHKADKFFEELVMYSNQVKRHEKWLHMIAEKIGIKLEY